MTKDERIASSHALAPTFQSWRLFLIVQAKKSALRVGEAKWSGIGSSCIGKDGVIQESKRKEGKAPAGLILSGDVRDRLRSSFLCSGPLDQPRELDGGREPLFFKEDRKDESTGKG